MKTLPSIIGAYLLTVCLSSPAQQLRLIRTNLVDFAAASQQGPNSPWSNYWACGQVVAVHGNTLIVSHQVGWRMEYKPSPSAMLLAGPSDQLQMLYLSSRVSEHRPISPGEFMTMDPLMRLRLYAGARQIPVIERIAVFHCDEAHAVGDEIACLGVRMGAIQLANVPGEGPLVGFDCGAAYKGDAGGSAFYRAMPTGLQPVRRQN